MFASHSFMYGHMSLRKVEIMLTVSWSSELLRVSVVRKSKLYELVAAHSSSSKLQARRSPRCKASVAAAQPGVVRQAHNVSNAANGRYKRTTLHVGDWTCGENRQHCKLQSAIQDWKHGGYVPPQCLFDQCIEFQIRDRHESFPTIKRSSR